MIDVRSQWKTMLWMTAAFLCCYYMPLGEGRFDKSVMEALGLVKWYAREHVLLCLVPALFIAGAISVFVSQASVMKYLGPKANKFLAYLVASVSGGILAVCSCTILPLFSGIYRMGAGLGPASTFLYCGPAINVMAIILTARILGIELGVARGLGAIVFGIVIGLLMHFIFRKEEVAKAEAAAELPEPEVRRPLWKTSLWFAAMVAVLVFANWSRAEDSELWNFIHSIKWVLATAAALSILVMLVLWFRQKWVLAVLAVIPAIAVWLVFPGSPNLVFTAGVLGLAAMLSTDKGEGGEWLDSTWGYAKQILPLLLAGVLVSGFLLGRPGEEAMIPSSWISDAVGGNSLRANFLASFIGTFMYFATLTEVPILQGLIGSGMGQGPALALLLAGPALSLPSMLVIHSVLGFKKTFVYVTLVVVMSTITGMIYGSFFN